MAADVAALPFADGATFRRGSLLAALAHGVPTITTTDDRRPTTDTEVNEPRVSGQWSVVGGRLEDGENVILVSPGDPAGLAGAIERLAGDAELRARIGAVGRALAAQFSWETIAERHEALYQQLLAQMESAQGAPFGPKGTRR
jgi:glycosyltransferase involved in cell wall biosynthesis